MRRIVLGSVLVTTLVLGLVWFVILPWAMADPPGSLPRAQFGRFQGELIVKPLADGRNMKLLEDYEYVEPSGERWPVRAGYETDGASIPQFAWSVVGGPFEGLYRNAAVIHDAYCDRKSRYWKDVHRMFYTAMLANGVPETKAKVMYAAVYHQGPRWQTFPNCPPPDICWPTQMKPPDYTLSQQQLETLMALIEASEGSLASYYGNAMSLEDIESFQL